MIGQKLGRVNIWFYKRLSKIKCHDLLFNEFNRFNKLVFKIKDWKIIP